MSQSDRIPALTILQPWASLIMLGVEPHVVPNWASQHIHAGAQVAIHASPRPARKSEIAAIILRYRAASTPIGPFGDRDKVLLMLEAMRELPLGLPLAAVLGTARLGQPFELPDALAAAALGSGILGAKAYPVGDIVEFSPYVPAKGRQGFWMWQEPRTDRLFA